MPPEQTSPPQPESSRVEVQRDEQGASIYIPPLRFSKYGRGLCFGLCFSSLPGLLIGAMVYRFVSHVTSGRKVEWQDLLVTFGIVAILLIFLAAGLLIVVTSLTEATQRTKISIRNHWLSASQKYLLRSWQETWPADAIHSLNVVNASDQNYPDRFHLELRLRTPGDFRKLVENRSQAEVEWIAGLLCQDLHCEVVSGSATQTEDRPNWKELTTGQPDSKHFLPGETSDLQQDIQGAAVCSRCDSVYRIAEYRLNCQNCGAPLVLKEETGVGNRRHFVGSFARLESLIDWSHTAHGADQIWFASTGPSMKEQVEGFIQCGWCEELYEQRPNVPNCARCGGVLPLPTSSEPGPKPPAPPRTLPWGFTYRLYFKLNRIGAISLILIAASLPMRWLHWLPALGILGLGLAVGYVAFVRRFRRFLALQHGRAVLGRIETVHVAKSYGKHRLYRVYYRFDIEQRPVRGVKWTYSSKISNHFVGEPVGVVYLDRHPKCNDLWPPFN